MTLREAVAGAAACLASAEHLAGDARRDAELLLLHTLGISRAQLLANPDRALTDEQESCYEDAIRRRLRYEPVQYITGQQEFYGLAFRVTPAVLIPRPETEHLVEAVLEHFHAEAARPLRIADVGTGSGAIAVALAAHLAEAEIIATDSSFEALEVAKHNASAHDVAARIRFVQVDLLDIPVAVLGGTTSDQFFDAVVSNPPYIPQMEEAELHPQVREYEPRAALFGGESGLDVYRRLVPLAMVALKPGGLLALELGHNQRAALDELLQGWGSVRFIEDLQGISRVVVARRPT